MSGGWPDYEGISCPGAYPDDNRCVVHGRFPAEEEDPPSGWLLWAGRARRPRRMESALTRRRREVAR